MDVSASLPTVSGEVGDVGVSVPTVDTGVFAATGEMDVPGKPPERDIGSAFGFQVYRKAGV